MSGGLKEVTKSFRRSEEKGLIAVQSVRSKNRRGQYEAMFDEPKFVDES